MTASSWRNSTACVVGPVEVTRLAKRTRRAANTKVGGAMDRCKTQPRDFVAVCLIGPVSSAATRHLGGPQPGSNRHRARCGSSSAFRDFVHLRVCRRRPTLGVAAAATAGIRKPSH
jgi:hypothetical protein